MKTLILTALILLTATAGHAPAQTTNDPAPAARERQTNYWSLTHPNWPALPALPATNLPLKAYFVGSDRVNILFDDSKFVYPTNEALSTNPSGRPSRIFHASEPRIVIPPGMETNAFFIEAL